MYEGVIPKRRLTRSFRVSRSEESLRTSKRLTLGAWAPVGIPPPEAGVGMTGESRNDRRKEGLKPRNAFQDSQFPSVLNYGDDSDVFASDVLRTHDLVAIE